MQPVMLRVTFKSGRRASGEAFPRRAWERSIYLNLFITLTVTIRLCA